MPFRAPPYSPMLCSCRSGIGGFLRETTGRRLPIRVEQRLARRDARLSREREKSGAYFRRNPPEETLPFIASTRDSFRFA